jgi:hypothetical protein
VSPGEVDLTALWLSRMSVIDYLVLTEAVAPDCQARAACGGDPTSGLTDDEVDLIHAVKRRCDRAGHPYHIW